MKDFLSRKHFPSLIFLLILLPVLVLSIHNYTKTREDLKKYSFSRLQALVHLAAITLKEKSERLEDLGTALGTRIQFKKKVRTGKWNEAIKIMEEVPNNFPLIERVILIDSEGHHRAETPVQEKMKGKNYSPEEWFSSVKKQSKPLITEIQKSYSPDGPLVINVAIAINDKKKNFLAVLLLQVNPSQFFNWINGIKLGSESFIYVIDKKGTLATSPKIEGVEKFTDKSSSSLIQKVLQGKQGVESTILEKDVPYIAAYETVKNYGWGIIAIEPEKSAFGQMKANLNRLKLLYGIIFFLSCLLAFLISRIMMKLIKAQKEIKDASQFMELILDYVPNMIVVKNARDLRFLQVNKAGEELLGYTKKEFVGKRDTDFFTKEQATFFNYWDAEAFRTKKIMEIPEEKILTRHKGERLLRTQKIPVFDKKGDPQYLITICEDITDIKKMREERERSAVILKSAERISFLIQHSLDAVMAINEQGTVTSWNQQAENIFGWKVKEALGSDLSELILPPRFHGQFRQGLNDFLRTEKSLILNKRIELSVMNKDKKEFPVELAATATKEDQGYLIYGFIRDISEQKQLEQQQRALLEKEHQAREVAEKLVNMRDDFLSIAAHELKTPLTPISIQLQVIERALNKWKESGPSPTMIDNLLQISETSKKEITRLSKLVDELLDVSRITGGRLQINREEVDLSALVNTMIQRYSTEDLKHGSTITSYIEENILGLWDRFRLESVVENLLTNAIKYGERRPIEITLKKTQDKAILSVRDHGIGIADVDKEKIFKRFERAVSVKNFSGLGLGLYISNKIVEAHEGKIRVESEVGKGSNFIVELPVGPTPSHFKS